MSGDPNSLPQADIDALYRVVAERRDVRNGFRPDPVDDVADPGAGRRAPGAERGAQPAVGLPRLRDREVRERGARGWPRRQQDVFAATLPGARAPGLRPR